MTREQAVKILRPMLDSFVDYANITMKIEDDNNADALVMAIEALKQPEIIHCKDCVSYHDTIDKETGCLLGIYVCELFEDEPPADWYCADAERRTDETD